jgi:glycosyltransferase involved in cell wall biosynthesis
MPATPTVSVVMPVYNGERYLAEAIDSILGQTFTDFELIVVDDGSNDGTRDILGAYERRDQRVRVHRHSSNQGISATRNQGCRMARGRFIAVMDADDVSLPERFEIQVPFLNANPDVAAVGSWVQRVDATGVRLPLRGRYYVPPPALIAWSMIFCNIVVHSTVMMRREAINLEAVYDDDYPVAEDYKLLLRLSHVERVAVLPKILVLYRTWPGNISRSSRLDEQAARVVRTSLGELGVHISAEQAEGLQGLSRDRFPASPASIRSLADLINRLREIFLVRVARDASDRRLINRDCAIKFWLLSALALRRSPFLALSLAMRATRTQPLAFVPFTARVFERLGNVALTRTPGNQAS